MKKTITMMALALLAASGNLQANPKSTLPPQPKTGTLIIYRVRMYPGGGRTYSFAIDGSSRYHLKNGRYMQFELPAGNHVLTRPFDITLSFHAGTEKVHINPGQTTYFQYVDYPMMGMVFEVGEDQVNGQPLCVPATRVKEQMSVLIRLVFLRSRSCRYKTISPNRRSVDLP